MVTFLVALGLLSTGAAGSVRDFTPSNAPNMNGEYPFAVTPGGRPGLFPSQYRDYPGGVEYYEVISEAMTTLYSQVWWTPLAPMPFPQEMVQKYAGRKVAIVGWEIDQVRNGTSGWHSVPISASYNHHYTAQVIGSNAHFQKVHLSGPDDPRTANIAKGAHGHIQFDQPHYMAAPRPGSGPLKAEDHQTFSNANGGEYRKTYHGYAPGYGIVVDSPAALQVTPMQIDTWNRAEMDIEAPSPPKFVAGPLPRASQAPKDAPLYSGLLECPLTTRLTKVVDGDYQIVRSAKSGDSTCENHAILTYQECFHAAAATLSAGGANSLRFHNITGKDPNRPSGCSATAYGGDSWAQALTVQVFFNELRNATGTCGGGTGSGAGSDGIVQGASAPVSLDGAVRVAVSLDNAHDNATITLAGPADVWFGVGFGAVEMADRPWTVVVEGQGGAVSERHLGGPAGQTHQPGDALAPSVSVVSDVTVAATNTRTVVLTRPIAGTGPSYYSFNPLEPALPFIAAVGTGAALAAHRDKASARLNLLPAGQRAAGACVCPQQPAPFGAATGSIVYNAVANQSADVGSGASAFGGYKSCRPMPATELLEQRNPTCDVRYYRGGQWACHHMWSLLDADQEIPWVSQPLVFHHKWRLWVQPYNESYHTPVTYGFGTELLLGSPYEYDVPDCTAVPTPAGCSFDTVTHTWVHTVTGNTMGQHHFSALNFHCHAPTCMSMAVYACDKSVPLAACNTSNGRLLCEERPIYGGTGASPLNGTRFDEPGYIAIPQCHWGSAQFGLEAPPDLTGVPLHMVKRANATWPHTGEMAGGQPWVF